MHETHNFALRLRYFTHDNTENIFKWEDSTTEEQKKMSVRHKAN